MSPMVSTTYGSSAIADSDFDARAATARGPVPDAAVMTDPSAVLLRTIAEVLDIRSVFPRVSAIVKRLVPHDALELVFQDRDGQVTLEAASVAELPGYTACAAGDDEAFSIVRDLRWMRRRETTRDAWEAIDALLADGYRSVLGVRCVAQRQVMRLVFLSKQTEAYTTDDVAAAQRVADYVALAVAHEQLAAAERDRAEARGRSERVDARVKALAENGEALPHGRMIGRSHAWQRVVARALRVAPTDATVFLQGESGTGKEVVARFVHQTSPRKDGPFVAINCAALPEQLLESELFGYERGAFTGAQQAKAGHIELAARGVLFLDEVSEMSLAAQAKLLRFLQEREFQRLGGTRVQKANVRVIAASNRDLRQAVERGQFREDLLYRLQVFDIRLPALRERISDVPLLADQFLAEFGAALGHRSPRLADDARDVLMAHTWPGNIRELRNVLESAAILSDDGVIERRHVSLQSAHESTVVSSTDLSVMERQTIETVLRETDGNKSKTARRLGLTRTQLYVRLRRHGLEHASTA